MEDMLERLPALPLDAFKNTGAGILSGKFPALAKSQIEKLAEVLVDGGSEQWRLQIAHKATIMPASALFKHINKLAISAAADFKFPSTVDTAEAVVEIIGPEAKACGFKRNYPGRVLLGVFADPMLIVKMAPIFSDALTVFYSETLSAASKGGYLDAEALAKAVDTAIFAPSELSNFSALATAVARLPKAVAAGLIDKSIVDGDLRIPVQSTLLTGRALANPDAALNLWIAKPVPNEGDE